MRCLSREKHDGPSPTRLPKMPGSLPKFQDSAIRLNKHVTRTNIGKSVEVYVELARLFWKNFTAQVPT